MLSRMQMTKVATRSVRSMSTHPMLEEFPIGVVVQPKKPTAPVTSFNKLPSGVRTAISSQSTSTATIKIGVLGGSSAESSNETGSAMVLACGAFDGNAHKNGVAVMRAFEDIGATVGAVSSREDISYTISVGSENLSQALDLAFDNFKAPISRDWMIEHAKRRAAVRHAQFQHDPCARVSELVHEASFGENTPLGSSMYSSNLKGLVASDVLHFRNTLFTTDNLCVAVTGAANGDAVKRQLDSLLSSGLASGKPAVATSVFTGGEMRVRESIGGATRVALAFAAPAGAAGKAHEVLRVLLSASVGSKGSHVQTHVHSKVHDYRSSTEWTDTFFNGYSASGMFGVNFLGDAKYVSAGLTSFISQLKAIAAGECSAEAVANAKTKLHLNALLSSGADRLYATLTTGNNNFSESDYASVTSADVVNAAKAALKSNPGYAVYGATYQVPFLTGVTKMMA